MSGPKRYRLVLAEEAETLPAVYRRPRRLRPVYIQRPADPLETLIEAFIALNRRGEGDRAWAPSLADNAISFLLDGVADAITLERSDGGQIFRNRAAQQRPQKTRRPVPLEELEENGVRIERRCMVFELDGARYMLEIVRELPAGGPQK
ncbi:MAG: hypothetical protein H6707_07110 [Deltaproteobacteria bacterium]|nr:hypothetical protein [Deltaproteobacteria bacterium]